MGRIATTFMLCATLLLRIHPAAAQTEDDWDLPDSSPAAPAVPSHSAPAERAPTPTTPPSITQPNTAVPDNVADPQQLDLARQVLQSSSKQPATVQVVLSSVRFNGDASAQFPEDTFGSSVAPVPHVAAGSMEQSGRTDYLIFLAADYPLGLMAPLPLYQLHSAVVFSPARGPIQIKLHRSARTDPGDGYSQDAENLAKLVVSVKTKLLAADILSITSYIIQTVKLPVKLPRQHTQWSKLTAEIVCFVTQHDEELEAHTAAVITDDLAGEKTVRSYHSAHSPVNALVLWKMEIPVWSGPDGKDKIANDRTALMQVRQAIGLALKAVYPGLASASVTAMVLPSTAKVRHDGMVTLSCATSVPSARNYAMLSQLLQLVMLAISGSKFAVSLVEHLALVGHSKVHLVNRHPPQVLRACTGLALQSLENNALPQFPEDTFGSEDGSGRHPERPKPRDVLAGFVVGVAVTVFSASVAYLWREHGTSPFVCGFAAGGTGSQEKSKQDFTSPTRPIFASGPEVNPEFSNPEANKLLHCDEEDLNERLATI